MSTAMEDEIKRWTAKRKSALVMGFLQGMATVDPSGIEDDDAG